MYDAQNIGEDIAASNYCKETQSGNALKIPHIVPKRVVKIFLSVPPHKATGDDEISAKLLKITASAISSQLCRLINQAD